MRDDWLHWLHWLQNLTPIQAAFWLLLENAVVFVGAVVAGYALHARFQNRRVAPPTPSLKLEEIFYTLCTIFLNTLVTWAGWWLWKKGIVAFQNGSGVRVLFDVVFLVMTMDAAMYALHRVAHWARIFPVVHRTHHDYDKPHPLSLFVLNPIESLSFGVLWLLLISLYHASWAGMAIYLALNVAFGIVGHLGVEPLPDAWKRWPILNLISTSTFHAQHHQNLNHNFGFYTLIWDKIFDTLSPFYDCEFGRLPAARER